MPLISGYNGKKKKAGSYDANEDTLRGVMDLFSVDHRADHIWHTQAERQNPGATTPAWSAAHYRHKEKKRIRAESLRDFKRMVDVVYAPQWDAGTDREAALERKKGDVRLNAYLAGPGKKRAKRRGW